MVFIFAQAFKKDKAFPRLVTSLSPLYSPGRKADRIGRLVLFRPPRSDQGSPGRSTGYQCSLDEVAAPGALGEQAGRRKSIHITTPTAAAGKVGSRLGGKEDWKGQRLTFFIQMNGLQSVLRLQEKSL